MTGFALHGEISAEGDHVVLIAGGDPHELIKAAQQLVTCTPKMKSVEGVLCFPLTWMGVTQLAFTYGSLWKPGPRLTQWIREQVALRTTYLDRKWRYQIPEGLTPYWWQTEGAKMIAHLGGLETDDPGLGKTITAILGLCERDCWGRKVWPVICVVPPSTVDGWVRAWNKWAPHVSTVAWRGRPEQRVELIGRHQVYVTGYALTRNDATPGLPLKHSPLMRIKAATVVCDESHNIKNHEAIQTRATRRLGRAAQLFIPMSGTPFEHNFSELQPVLDTMLPGACPDKARLANRWCLELPGDYDARVVGLNPEREPELRTALLGQVVGRRKKDVLEDLPPKIYSVREVELPPIYRKIYNDMERRMLAELEDGTELTVMAVLAKLTRLQQLSTAACDVEVVQRENRRTGELKDHQVVHPRLPSWKIDALIEVLDERAGVHPVLAFAPSRELIVLAGEVATKAGYRVGYVIGGQKPAERTGYIDAFQAGELDLMCATIEAGGEGLTLTAAGTNVFLQRSIRLIRHLQSEDRSWGRVDGSEKKSVEIIDIWAKNTVDARIKKLLLMKAGQLGEFLQDPRLVKTLFGGEEAQVAA